MNLEYIFNGLFDDSDIGFGRLNHHINQLANVELISHLPTALELRLKEFCQETALGSMFAVGFR
jgi:hypothetical protein